MSTRLSRLVIEDEDLESRQARILGENSPTIQLTVVYYLVIYPQLELHGFVHVSNELDRVPKPRILHLLLRRTSWCELFFSEARICV
jgi:hypothetical protein